MRLGVAELTKFGASNLMNLTILRLFAVCAILTVGLNANSAAGDLPDVIDGVRFDLHRQAKGFTVVARGKPSESQLRLSAAFAMRTKAMCPDAIVDGLPKQSEYEYLEGGAQYLMPACGTYLQMTTYNTVQSAPALTGFVTCQGANEPAPAIPRLKVAIENALGENIAYIDQGFASFNRERLDVPLSGDAITDLLAHAVKDALAARGYDVEIVSPTEPNAARIRIGKAPVPGERFEGIAMLTKIGLLGIQNLSAAFCSIDVAIDAAGGNTPRKIGGVSTREMLPAIYSSWKQDMTNGPSESTHTKTSAILAKTLSANVRAAIHAMPAKSLEFLFSQQTR